MVTATNQRAILCVHILCERVGHAFVFCYILIQKRTIAIKKCSLQIRDTDIYDKVYNVNLHFILHIELSALEL